MILSFLSSDLVVSSSQCSLPPISLSHSFSPTASRENSINGGDEDLSNYPPYLDRNYDKLNDGEMMPRPNATGDGAPAEDSQSYSSRKATHSTRTPHSLRPSSSVSIFLFLFLVVLPVFPSLLQDVLFYKPAFSCFCHHIFSSNSLLSTHSVQTFTQIFDRLEQHMGALDRTLVTIITTTTIPS